MSAIDVKLNVFEGPLDLLLHLIEKNKVNIYDIPIVTITEQYLDYVNHMEEEDLDVMSEFPGHGGDSDSYQIQDASSEGNRRG